MTILLQELRRNKKCSSSFSKSPRRRPLAVDNLERGAADADEAALLYDRLALRGRAVWDQISRLVAVRAAI